MRVPCNVLHTFERGEVKIDSHSLGLLSDTELSRLRNKSIGIILQSYALLEEYSVYTNVVMPLYFSKLNTLNVLTQVISPYTQCTYLRQDLRIPHIFSFYRLHVFQQKIMNENGHNLNVERHQTMDFFLGDIKATNVLNSGDNQGVILKQADFLPSNNTTVPDKDILDEEFYEAQVALSEPLPLSVFLRTYSSLFKLRQLSYNLDETREKLQYQGGIIWVAIKTSDKLDDICLGVCGPFSAYYFDKSSYTHIKGVEGDNLEEYIALFADTLKLLSDNEKEANLYLTKFFHYGELDFDDRLSYAEHNDYICIGFTIYLRGDMLKMLANDPFFQLIEIYQKGIDGIEDEKVILPGFSRESTVDMTEAMA